MTQVLDFCAHLEKKKQNEIQTTAIDRRVTVFLEVIKRIIVFLQTTKRLIPEFTFCHNIRSETFRDVNFQSQQLFVKLPNLIKHSVILHGFLPYTIQPKEGDDPEKMKTDYVTMFNTHVLQCIMSEDFLNALNVYTIVPEVERTPNKIVIKIQCINTNDIVMVTIDFDPDSLGISFKMFVDLYVTVEQNTVDMHKQLNNLDHIYAVDLLSYCASLLQWHTGSKLI